MGRSIADRHGAYGLVAFAAASYACLMFVWFSLPAYLPTIVDDVGLTNTQAGVLAGAIPLTYIPLALVSGLAVDRVGPGRIIGAGVLVYGAGQIGRSTAREFPSLLAFTLLMGVGATTITFGLPKLVSVLFPPAETGRPSAIYLVGASAGSAFVFAVGRPVLGPALGGWRPLFFWGGVVSILYGVCWLAVALRTGIDESTSEGDASFSATSILADLRLVLSHRDLQLVVVVGTMFLLLNHGMQGWLPTVLESRGLTATLSGQATSLFVAAYVVGVLGIPELADRLTARRLTLAVCGAVAFAGVVGVMAGGTGPATFAGIVATGIGTGGVSPLVRAIPPALEGIGARLTGTAMGFIFAVGELGGFFGPALIGLGHDATGSFLPGLGLLATGGLVVVLAGGTLYYRAGPETAADR